MTLTRAYSATELNELLAQGKATKEDAEEWAKKWNADDLHICKATVHEVFKHPCTYPEIRLTHPKGVNK